ncbi:nitrile hydratase accessory protein [Methylobacterium sp. A54F]
MSGLPGPAGPAAESPFGAPWEAQVFGLVVSLQERGVFTWAEWAAALGEAAGAQGGTTDYAAWLTAVETLMARRGIAEAADLAARRDAFARAAEATPHGQPILLANDPGP